MHRICSECFVCALHTNFVRLCLSMCADVIGSSVPSLGLSLQQADLVKVDLLLNASPVDALAFIAHKEAAQRMARQLVARLRETIDRWERGALRGRGKQIHARAFDLKHVDAIISIACLQCALPGSLLARLPACLLTLLGR